MEFKNVYEDLISNTDDYFGEMRKFAQEYQMRFGQATNVLEIGSRDGYHADYLKKYFNIPDNKVFIVDAHPDCAKLIRREHPNYRVIETAITQNRGIVSFNAVQNLDLGALGASSTLPRKDGPLSFENWVNVISIKGFDLLQLINEREYDLVKIDVEGLTYEVLESFGDSLGKIKMIHTEGEYFEVWEGQKLYSDLRDLLTRRGFEEAYRVDMLEGQCDTVWYRV